ncbi:MAG TPA: hypothetical protein VKT80_09560 [Chloroflexota bacterium]|nr:hypothetical protein [Chloroflexota bacterium]
MKSDRERHLEEFPDFGDEEDPQEFFDCAMDRSGWCGKAGSEECEFECPYRAEQRSRDAQNSSSGTGSGIGKQGQASQEKA